jgi:hypothetical protein
LVSIDLGLTMSDPSPDTPDPTFEREKWEADLRLREREIALKERELDAKIIEQKRDRWRSPLVLAILGAILAAGGNAWLEQRRTEGQQTIEEAKAEAARILDMIKTANPDKAAENLDFLVKAGLIENQIRRVKLERFLKERPKGKGPNIPPSPALEPQMPRSGFLAVTCRLSKPHELSIIAQAIAKAFEAPPINVKSEIYPIPDGLLMETRGDTEVNPENLSFVNRVMYKDQNTLTMIFTTELRQIDGKTVIKMILNARFGVMPVVNITNLLNIKDSTIDFIRDLLYNITKDDISCSNESFYLPSTSTSRNP